MTATLRSEAAAKDSALIVSHYELHKERVVRERLESKNMKLMERLQKLMMVVENQRREKERIEDRLQTTDRICEDKDRQLVEISMKARELQKLLKQQNLQNNIPAGGPSGRKKQGGGIPASPQRGRGRTPRSGSRDPNRNPQNQTSSGLVGEALPGISRGVMSGGGNPALAETY